MNASILDKRVEIRLSRRAERALAERSSPLMAEMELLFSCLIRKRVRFGETGGQEAVPVSDRLSVSFRPVMTKACTLADIEGETPLADFPIADPGPYVPRWLAIDYRRGEWSGQFGY